MNIPTTSDDIFRTFESIYHDYLRLLGETWDELVRKIMVAQDTGCRKSNEASGKAGADANDYAEAVRQAWDESQDRYVEAYKKYLAAYHEAWSAIDLRNVSQQTLIIVLDSAMAAAGYARSTIANWALIAWTGVPPWTLGRCGETSQAK